MEITHTMKSIKLSDWCKENSISYSAGWRMFKAGKLPNAKQLPTGTIIVVEEDQVVNTKPEYNVVYARVSSNEQAKTNLTTQADRVSRFIEARGKTVNRVVKEVGSGLNDNRKLLNSILDSDDVTDIYIEHKDRLTRFGYNYIEKICQLKGITIHVINETETDEDDIMKDFVSLVTSFCSRLYGLRRSKRKTEELIKALQSDNG